MSGLIRKGGFRERANRSARFDASENMQTQLAAHVYTNHDASSKPNDINMLRDGAETHALQTLDNNTATLHLTTQIDDKNKA